MVEHPMASTPWRPARALAVTGTLAALAFATLAAGTHADPSATIPTYRGDAARTGVMPGPAPGGHPSVLWRFQADHRLASSPTLQEGILHVVSADGLVHGLALEDGASDGPWTSASRLVQRARHGGAMTADPRSGPTTRHRSATRRAIRSPRRNLSSTGEPLASHPDGADFPGALP
jgi:hypothetical protein